MSSHKRVEALKDAQSRLEAAFDAILAGEELEVAAPEPEQPGFFVPWATAAKVGLAGTGLAAALALMIAGYGWPLTMPELSRASSSGRRSRVHGEPRGAMARDRRTRARAAQPRESRSWPREPRQSRPHRHSARPGDRTRPQAAQSRRARLSLRAGSVACARAKSLSGSFSISAQAARRFRSMRKRARGLKLRPSSAMAGSAAWLGRRTASPTFSPAKPTSRRS